MARPVDVKVPRTKSREEVAATRMSALYRGYVARKQFTSLLYSKYVKVVCDWLTAVHAVLSCLSQEDAAISDKETRRLQEGMALLDTYDVVCVFHLSLDGMLYVEQPAGT